MCFSYPKVGIFYRQKNIALGPILTPKQTSCWFECLQKNMSGFRNLQTSAADDISDTKWREASSGVIQTSIHVCFTQKNKSCSTKQDPVGAKYTSLLCVVSTHTTRRVGGVCSVHLMWKNASSNRSSRHGALLLSYFFMLNTNPRVIRFLLDRNIWSRYC